MLLTADNYHSPEANQKYLSCSQYKDFCECEAMAMASIRGEWKRSTTNDCLVGSYIHAWNEGPEALARFKATTPDMFKKNGEPLAAFAFADTMIQTLESDPFCMYMLDGQKEVIMTAEMFGAPWKIKIDTYKTSEAIVDLKTTRSIWELQWSAFYNCKVSFIEIYQYFIQFAIYLEIERRAKNRENWLTPYIVAASKENPPDKAVIDLNDPARIKQELKEIEVKMPRILALKSGEAEPKRCGKCAYCRASRLVTDIISYKDLEEAI